LALELSNSYTCLLIALEYHAALLDVLLGGFFLSFHIPIQILCLILSPVHLDNYTKQHPKLSGP